MAYVHKIINLILSCALGRSIEEGMVGRWRQPKQLPTIITRILLFERINQIL
jgi:hypothetical protein